MPDPALRYAIFPTADGECKVIVFNPDLYYTHETIVECLHVPTVERALAAVHAKYPNAREVT